jgi:hypothetical protein
MRFSPHIWLGNSLACKMQGDTVLDPKIIMRSTHQARCLAPFALQLKGASQCSVQGDTHWQHEPQPRPQNQFGR